MEFEPRHSLRRKCIHEASHVVCAALHLCELGVATVYKHENACYFAIGDRDDVELYSSIQAAVALAGGVGEALLCGDDGHLGAGDDERAALAAIKDSRAWGWGLPTARAAYVSIVERILRGNQDLVSHVARQLYNRRYLQAAEVGAVVAEGKRLYEFRPSPLMRQDWRAVLDGELACQRRVEQLTAQEVARSQVLAARIG